MRTLPVWSDSFPFKVSYSIHRNNSISIHIDHPAGWARLLLDTLQVLAGLGDRLRFMADAAEREVRLDDFQARRLCRFAEVYAAYLALRAAGNLHRESIRALSADSSFTDLHFSRADFSWCVSLMKGRADSAPNRPTPLPFPSPAKHTRCRGRG